MNSYSSRKARSKAVTNSEDETAAGQEFDTMYFDKDEI